MQLQKGYVQCASRIPSARCDLRKLFQNRSQICPHAVASVALSVELMIECCDDSAFSFAVRMSQVSSRGCSRAYILCVLYRALKYVRKRRLEGQAVTFPFNISEIENWLVQAKDDCRDLDFQRTFGGTDFCLHDSSTFWTHSSHYFTWWKNNVERKNKFFSLLQDSDYRGDDDKAQLRARFCKQAIALSVNIKNHFERVLNQQVDRTLLTQIVLPYAMPAHLEADCVTTSHCSRCTPFAAAGPLTGSNTQAQLVLCERCVHLISYEDYLHAVLTSRVAKTSKRPPRVEFSSRGRKRTRYDEPYVPTARTARPSAVPLRASSRSVQRSMATVTIPDDCSTGSALLLGMKKSRVDHAGFASNEDSSDSSQDRNRGSLVLHDSDSDAPFAYQLEPFPTYRSSASPSLPVGGGLDGLHLDGIASLEFGDGVFTGKPLLLAGSGAAAHPFVPYNALFPPTRGETPDLCMRNGEPGGGAVADLGAADSGNGSSSAAQYFSGGASLDDGRSLHEFLVACYRDGIYPSPAAPASVNKQQLYYGPFTAATAELPATMSTSGSDSGGSGGDRGDGGVYGKDAAGTETDSEDRAGAQLQQMVAGLSVSGQAAATAEHTGGASEGEEEGAAGVASAALATGHGAGIGQGAGAAFAYEDLQLFLSHLLQEPGATADLGAPNNQT